MHLDKRDLVVHFKTSFARLQMIAKEMDNQENIDANRWMKWIRRFRLTATVDAENLLRERESFWSSTCMEETLHISPTFSFVQKVLECIPKLTFRDLVKSLPREVRSWAITVLNTQL